MEIAERDIKIDQALAALNQGKANETLTHCQSILEENMEDAEAWSIYGLAGIQFEPEKGIQALQRAVQLEPKEPRWRIHLGLGFGRVQKHVEAEQVLKGAVELTNGADEAVIPWANSLLQLGQLEAATSALRDAAEKNESSTLWVHLSNVLSANDDLIGSVSAREQAYAGKQIPREEQLNIANQHVLLGQYDQSQEYVDDLLAQDKDAPDTILLAANLMRWRGELDQAHEFLSQSVSANKQDPRLLLALLDLNKAEHDSLIGQAKSWVEDEKLPSSIRRGLSFVVARRADKDGAYDEAWNYALKANALYDDGARAQIDQYRQQLDMGMSLYKQINPQKQNDQIEHIYVVGPPRSGGSLLQTIIAAAPNVMSVGERGALMSWFLPMLEQGKSLDKVKSEWNRISADLQKADIAGILRSHGQNRERIYVDKMPHHAHIVGLLDRIHPGSKFVDVRRDPFDIATSIFFHDFNDKFGYSRSIDDIADYLGYQRRAIQSWKQLGVDIHLHDHNEFLDAPEMVAETLFEKLNIPWDESYLDPEKRTSTVRTFSALQVRSKVTKAYSGRGERYREFMGDAANRLDDLKANV